MRRNWQSLRTEGGDEDAARWASVLAGMADAELIESIVHGVSALDRFGGELRIGAYRQKFNGAGDRVEGDEVGTYETVGYLYDYNHHFKPAPTERNYNPDDPPALDDPREDDEEPALPDFDEEKAAELRARAEELREEFSEPVEELA